MCLLANNIMEDLPNELKDRRNEMCIIILFAAIAVGVYCVC